jgi:hypothetical protein
MLLISYIIQHGNAEYPTAVVGNENLINLKLIIYSLGGVGVEN